MTDKFIRVYLISSKQQGDRKMHNQPDNESAHPVEPEETYCDECGSTMTEESYCGVTWLSCDSCVHVQFEGDEYE